MTLREIQSFVKKISKTFSENEDAFDILSRLLEECGEVASEIRKLEKKGSKNYFHIVGDKKKLADEIVDILNVLAALANLYDLDLEKECKRRNAHINKVLGIKD